MLGTTLTITIGGSGGTDKVLNRIADDGYSAEYLLRESSQEFRAKVKHSNSGSRDRHYVEIKQTVFAASSDEDDTVYTVSAVILAPASADSAVVTDLQEALSYFLDGANTPKILTWNS